MSLISADQLAARIGDPALRIVDTRWYLGRPGDGRVAYDAGHVPGAIYVDLDTDLRAPEGPGRHPLPDPSVFTERLGMLGIGSEHDVVVYDDVGGGIAARLWWMLDDLGHRSVAVLDGGFLAWVQGGHPVEIMERTWPKATLDLGDHWTNVTDRDELRSRLGEAVLLDARGARMTEAEVAMLDRLLDLSDNDLWDLISARQEPDDASVWPLLEQLRAA